MSKPFRGVVNVDVTKSVPDWGPYTQPIAPEGTPSVLYIVLDDVGYSAMGAYGGLIDTPNIDRLAQRGLTYTNFHTTALCSPTRSCLMTGRNHTTNGMATITEAASGFPSSNGHIPFECGTIAEVLGERGWNTYMTGKWHLTAEDEMNMASRKTQWPLGRGFERFYGFLGAETNQWYPELVYDNHPVEQPSLPAEGYHLTTDLTDKALAFIRDAKAVAPDKPFFLYFCPGACHAPHHAPKEWIDKYRGKFDMGYEAYREQVFERQKKLGVVNDKAELSPMDPYRDDTSTDGKPWPELDTVRPWESLSDDEKRLFARMAEVYAGFLGHADHEIGRLLDYLEQSDQLDNTIVVLVSDNGASGEGGPNGSFNENKLFNGLPDTAEANLPHLEELGQPGDVQSLSDGLGVGLQHAVQAVEALLELRGRHRRPADRVVAGPDQCRRPAASVRARRRHRADLVLTARHRAARRRQGLHAVSARGCQLRRDPQRAGGDDRQADAVLLDGRHPGHLAPRLEGWRDLAGRPGRVGQLRHPAVGAVQHGRGPDRVPRSLGTGTRPAAGAHPAVVGTGRPVRRAAAGEPQCCRDPHDGPPAAEQAPQQIRLLSGRLGDPGVRGAEHPQPLLHRGCGGRHREC